MRPHHDTRVQSRFEYLQVLSDFLRQRAEIHRFWKTHSSTYGCWICDLLSTNEELIEMLNNLSPPSLGVDAEGYHKIVSESDNQ